MTAPPHLVATLRHLLATERRLSALGQAWWDSIGTPAFAACSTKQEGERLRGVFARAVSRNGEAGPLPPSIELSMMMAWPEHVDRWRSDALAEPKAFILPDNALAGLHELALMAHAHGAECDAVSKDLGTWLDNHTSGDAARGAITRLREEIGCVPGEELPGTLEVEAVFALDRQRQVTKRG